MSSSLTTDLATDSAPSAPPASMRALHLDLKGLPPTFERLTALLPLFAAANYTHLLVEWENIFPWTVDERWRHPAALSRDQVASFHEQAANHGLSIIPLVQTLGHLEMSLCLPEYRDLRAWPDRCDTLHPLADGAGKLLQAMIEDVLSVGIQPTHFHLGGDEANLPDRQGASMDHAQMMWSHYQPLLETLHQRGIRPVLWHDMIAKLDDASLKQFSNAADIVVWGYRGHPDHTTSHFHTRVVERFHQAGATLWGGCAYKGADGAHGNLPNRDARLLNTRAWVDMAQRYGFHGLIATAWSRYNSFRVQCDPMDAALDLLCEAGSLLHGSDADDDTLAAQSRALLESTGLLPGHERCVAIMKQLDDITRAAWLTLRSLREQIVVEQHKPQWANSSVDDALFHNLQADCHRLANLAQPLRDAFAGLMPVATVDELLAERLLPIRDEADELARRTGRQIA